ncbi:hypothetical protein BGZ63DRAFT_321968, partial [Mariannaea sp. PMI_226]
SLKPTRRKLQKSEPKIKSFRPKRESVESSVSSASRKTESQIHNGAPDLSDAKWNDYLRPTTIVSVMSSEPSPLPSPLQLSQQCTIPELSHLTIRDLTGRSSLDSASIPSLVSSNSTNSIMRRQAKTPVFRIGQLERKQQREEQQRQQQQRQHWQRHAVRRDPEVGWRTSSVELIAEQYNALLESRGAPEAESTSEISSTPQMEPWQDILDVPIDSLLQQQQRQSRSRASSQPQPCLHPYPYPHPAPLQTFSSPRHSTSSREEVTVAFEEDAIYFKPISFSVEASPEPSPRLPRQGINTPPPSRPQSADNLSLQICLDLLTRELSSAMGEDRLHRGGSDHAALQIWVMIEAYERLRDQVTKMADINPQLANVGQIFDTWLSALYAMHGTMMENSVPNESEYDGLQEDLD